MSLRQELETWDSALKAYDTEDFEKALDLFGRIADSSKILTNMGLIYATLGEHELAVEQFNAATQLDQYLAVAYFQCGVSNFLLGRYDLAFKDFEEALLYLRGNQAINYEQLGLQFRLYSAEVLFNKGLCLIYMGNEREGVADMREAQKEKVTSEHNVIDEAIQDIGNGYTVFSIPVGILYRPSENKMKNAKPKDYLGKAKLVAAENANEAYTTFTGVTRMQQGYTPSGAPLDNIQSTDGNKGGANLQASASFSRARNPDTVKPVERAGSATARLERSNTTITPAGGAALQKSNTIGSRPVAAPPREQTNGGGGPRAGVSPPPANRNPRDVEGGNGPTRGLSVRRPDGPPGAGAGRGRGGPGNGAAGQRLTDIYDDYLDGYEEQPPPPDESSRVKAWASKTLPGPPAGPSRAVSQRIPAGQLSMYGDRSMYSGSGASVRRKLTRQNTSRSRAPTNYGDDDDDGYGSGDFDGGFELIRIKVKIHYNGEVRGMALTPEVPFDEFVDKVSSKFNKSVGDMSMKFIDEDGMRVSLRDESDYDLAIETARESAKGKPDGKLVVWIE